MTGSGSHTCIIWAADCIDSVSLTWIFSVPLDVLSIGFGNENDLHGLMKLSAFSHFCQWSIGRWLVALCGFSVASLGLLQLWSFLMIDELESECCLGMHCTVWDF
jgi:hypothetical protein